MLRALHDRGFKGSTSIGATHALPLEVKQYNKQDLIRRKSYMLCLLDVENLTEAGREDLPAAEIENFYRVILESDINVLPGLGDQAYKAMLKNLPPQTRMAIEDAERLGIENVYEDGQGGILDSIDCDVVVKRSCVDGVQVGHRQRSAPESSSSSCKPLVRSDGVQESGDNGIVVLRRVAEPMPVAMTLGETVEGCVIRNDYYEDATRRYNRWWVTCPLAKCRHDDGTGRVCQRSRTTSEIHTKKFGIAEVYGFPGCWIRHSSSAPCISRTNHNNYTPKMDVIAAYVAEMGWPVG